MWPKNVIITISFKTVPSWVKASLFSIGDKLWVTKGTCVVVVSKSPKLFGLDKSGNLAWVSSVASFKGKKFKSNSSFVAVFDKKGHLILDFRL